MNSSTVDRVIEADKDMLGHAEAAFAAFMAAEPNHDWAAAFVSRKDGLTLKNRDGSVTLHFKSALCGYVGDGVRSSAAILEAAGFGVKAVLMGTLSQTPSHDLVR